MKVVFIAGPYRDVRGEFYVNQNIYNARGYALSVWKEGGVALCPHMNTALFGGAEDIQDNTWLEGDLELIKRCDAVWVMSTYERSEGTCEEIKHAQRLGIPVLYSYDEMREFVRGG